MIGYDVVTNFYSHYNFGTNALNYCKKN